MQLTTKKQQQLANDRKTTVVTPSSFPFLETNRSTKLKYNTTETITYTRTTPILITLLGATRFLTHCSALPPQCTSLIPRTVPPYVNARSFRSSGRKKRPAQWVARPSPHSRPIRIPQTPRMAPWLSQLFLRFFSVMVRFFGVASGFAVVERRVWRGDHKCSKWFWPNAYAPPTSTKARALWTSVFKYLFIVFYG